MWRALQLCLLLYAPPKTLDERRLAVLPIEAPAGMLALGAELTHRTLEAGRTHGFTVLSPKEVQEQLGSEALSKVRACQGNAECAADILARVAADVAVLGRLDRTERTYKFELSMIDLRTAKVAAQVVRSVPITSRGLWAVVDSVLPAFYSGAPPPTGSLEVVTDPPAKVLVNDAPVGTAPLTVELPVGPHDVRAEREGYLAARRALSIEAGQRTRLELELVPKTAEALQAPAVVEVLPFEKRLRVPPSAWISAGLGAVAAGGGGYLGMLSRRRERTLRAGYDEATDTYSGTRREALEGRAQAVWANVLFGAAGSALVTAVGLSVLASLGIGAEPSLEPQSTGGKR